MKMLTHGVVLQKRLSDERGRATVSVSGKESEKPRENNKSHRQIVATRRERGSTTKTTSDALTLSVYASDKERERR